MTHDPSVNWYDPRRLVWPVADNPWPIPVMVIADRLHTNIWHLAAAHDNDSLLARYGWTRKERNSELELFFFIWLLWGYCWLVTDLLLIAVLPHYPTLVCEFITSSPCFYTLAVLTHNVNSFCMHVVALCWSDMLISTESAGVSDVTFGRRDRDYRYLPSCVWRLETR